LTQADAVQSECHSLFNGLGGKMAVWLNEEDTSTFAPVETMHKSSSNRSNSCMANLECLKSRQTSNTLLSHLCLSFGNKDIREGTHT